MSTTWNYDEQDGKQAIALQAFLPDKIFDFHAHIQQVPDTAGEMPAFWNGGPSAVTIADWQDSFSRLFGKKELCGGLFFPGTFPFANSKSSNEDLLRELDKNKLHRGLILVTPDDKPADILRWLNHPQVVGFKPYYMFSTEQPVMQSSIKGFFPEWQWKIAGDRGLIVMMHLVRDKAVSDPGNIEEIREMCSQYPNLKLILAHIARSFHAPNVVGLDKLRGLENVWFDMSAICEPDPIRYMIRQFGPRKLMWGSDFPISHLRAKAVSAGDGFVWLDDDFCNWEKARFANPSFIVVESLRAIQAVADEMGLNAGDLNDIFYSNAARILGLADESQNLNDSLYAHACQRIPGDGKLPGKRPENMSPLQWPTYFREARGCEVWDLDGKHYYDMSTNGAGACLLGYRDDDVTKAVIRRTELGSMCSLNATEEVELADLLCGIHPWAEQVRFARGGDEACAFAVQIARATTGRNVIAVCGYDGWQDGSPAATFGEPEALREHFMPGPDTQGVPATLASTAVTFRFNDLAGFQSVVDEHGKDLAAVLMEPCGNAEPDPGFLEHIRKATKACSSLLIFNEITVGWRMHYGGAHLRFGVYPDIAVFAKALGNGHPVAAIIGTASAMEGAHDSFISSTYRMDSIGASAAIATLKKMAALDLPAQVEKAGHRVMQSWRELADKYELNITVGGHPSLAHFAFNAVSSEKLTMLYSKLMLEKGFLAGLAFYPSLAHTSAVTSLYHQAIEHVFANIAHALHNGGIDTFLKGPVPETASQG